MPLSVPKKTAASEYFPIYLESLKLDSLIEFDLYVKVENAMILYRSSSTKFDENTLQTLLSNNVKRLYISGGNRSDYQKYIEKNIIHIINNSSIQSDALAGIIYDNAHCIIEDVFDKPTSRENMDRCKSTVESSVMYILKNEDSFQNLLRLMSFDYTTYTHSLNVCTFSIALGRYIGIEKADDLNRLGTGALLHDIGKTRIPQAILNKKGPLDDEEMQAIKQHPRWGFEIILMTKALPHESYYPILQHHEREDKSGYPHGISEQEIHLYSKIVAIADVFDAMTTQKVYRSAVESFPALKAMHTEAHKFDKDLLNKFTQMMGSD